LHDLALQRWLNATFAVTEGYPVPVVFASPMTAYAEFAQLWAADANPFRYLLDAKDEAGTPLYMPYPAPAVYPIISVSHAGWPFRANQTCSTRDWRPLAWATTDAKPSRQDVGTAIVMQRPSAWDFNYKVVHMCRRPDTQAAFVQRVMDAMTGSASAAQTFIKLVNPMPRLEVMERLVVTGGIEDLTEHDRSGADTAVIYQTGISLTIEGFSIPCSWTEVPVLWKTLLTATSADAVLLSQLYDFRQSSPGPARLRDAVPLSRIDKVANTRPDGSTVTQLAP